MASLSLKRPSKSLVEDARFPELRPDALRRCRGSVQHSSLLGTGCWLEKCRRWPSSSLEGCRAGPGKRRHMVGLDGRNGHHELKITQPLLQLTRLPPALQLALRHSTGIPRRSCRAAAAAAAEAFEREVVHAGNNGRSDLNPDRDRS